ncbi:MAG TPA: FAD-dependent oxidoreductase [Nitrosomonas sp.]|nr:FAD-dependent oxidoreductase [Nitrosomonas sp.]HMW21271.1 FAD-dependent oxidoreductase [Nitrosomonas sp.]HMY62039.1 FAD-dependent oxidoreductase [Nitrosomonas sp.]HMY90822.1 FAD-dependent oxidoreductase [Nitrosomonas sp.]HNB02199.1 FAD-dependent oxidoreductase [Nitrosomonas sp.]
MSQQPVVLIGSGLAGYGVARELRKLNSEIPITMLSADHGGFYSKPMLSNAIATGKTPESILNSSAVQMANQLHITIRPDTRVSVIDSAQKAIVLENGEHLIYGQLVLAMGADQIRLPLQGDGVADLLTVNDLDDYRHFRVALEGKKQIAILGAGLIGCEFANDLVGAGYEVHVIDISTQPLGRLLPSEGGRFLQEKLTAIGIKFHLKTITQRIDRMGDRLSLSFDDGTQLEVDLILSAVGLRPRIQLAQAAGIEVNRGIVTDRYLQTRTPDIYALGDCAEVEGKVLPFIMPISHASRALAVTLNGTPTLLRYPAMPVLVKTPACPTIVSPPDPDKEGEWRVDKTEDGIKALFQDITGNLLGFALLGDATKEKNALTPLLPAVLD